MQNQRFNEIHFTPRTNLKEFHGAEAYVPLHLHYGGLIKMQINNFNSFVNRHIKEIVEANKDHYLYSDGKLFLQYKDIYVGYPDIKDGFGGSREIFPNECRQRDLSYSADIYVDIIYQKGEPDKYVRRNKVLIGRMPIMLQSKRCNIIKNDFYRDWQMFEVDECPMDPGGYFIVKGAERVLMIQEQLRRNRIIVEGEGDQLTSSVLSSTTHKKSKTTILIKKDVFYLRHNSFSEIVPAYIVIKALGIESDQEAMCFIGSSCEVLSMMTHTLHQCKEVAKTHTTEMAKKYLEDKIRISGFEHGVSDLSKREILDRLLADVLLPHVECDGRDLRDKGIYLCIMIYRLITAKLNPETIDSREHYGNKRVELASSLLSLLFEDLFLTFNTDLRKIYERGRKSKSFDLYNAISHRFITDRMEASILTGNWVIKRFRMERHGVTQLLNRCCYLATLTHLTRIVSQFEKTRKAVGPRSIHATQFYFICPCDTPEGESCGLVKNLTLLAEVSGDIIEEVIAEVLRIWGTIDTSFVSGDQLICSSNYIVFLNGKIIGFSPNPVRLVKDIRTLRRMGHIHFFVNISLDDLRRFVVVSSDPGRLIRPFFRIKNGECLLSPEDEYHFSKKHIYLDDLWKKGIVEFVDSNEMEDIVVAPNRDQITAHSTHMEITNCALIGICASAIPFANHNPAPRLTYQCAMGKQTQGIMSENHYERYDSVIYNLIYPQKPLVKTKIMDWAKFDRLPAGQNALVAIASYSGYDLEDALIFNKASVERGLGRATMYRREVSYFDSCTIAENPVPATEGVRTPERYSSLESDGLPHIGIKVKPGHSLFMKNILLEDGTSIPQNKLSYRGVDDCYVDKIMLTSNDREKSIVKVKYRVNRIPEVGDKFSSRHGQKGVIGDIVSPENLPFTESGFIPDIIMNPHGFPSRMTVGKLLEILAGKAAALEGDFIDATIFKGDKRDVTQAILEKHGFHYMGEDIMYVGITGLPLQCQIYNGVVYYQRLKHMVGDKIHARSTGPVVNLTRQPTEGRNREGGLRIGEMERDCLIAYGASSLICERLVTSSDAFIVHICSKCGVLGTVDWCQNCRDGEDVFPIRMPYAFKLLVQELTSMNIVPKFILKDLI